MEDKKKPLICTLESNFVLPRVNASEKQQVHHYFCVYYGHQMTCQSWDSSLGKQSKRPLFKTMTSIYLCTANRCRMG